MQLWSFVATTVPRLQFDEFPAMQLSESRGLQIKSKKYFRTESCHKTWRFINSFCKVKFWHSYQQSHASNAFILLKVGMLKTANLIKCFFSLITCVVFSYLQWCFVQVFSASNFHSTCIIPIVNFQCYGEFAHENMVVVIRNFQK